VTSSSRYPTSNRKVENAVKTMKGLMKKARESGEDVFLSLLDWRNTPSKHLTNSPSQILFNRRTRTSLPTASSLLDSVSARAANIALTAAKRKQAYYYDRLAKDKVNSRPDSENEIRQYVGLAERRNFVSSAIPIVQYSNGRRLRAPTNFKARELHE